MPPAPHLIFIRHAKAEKDHSEGDHVRALTPDGREDFRAHAVELAKLAKVKRIVTSPLVRAVQTAEIAAAAFGLTKVEVRGELSPHWRAASRIVELALASDHGTALVGHNPSLEEAVAEMLGLKKLPFKFKKGGAVAMLREGKKYEFAWFAAPGAEPLKSLPEE